MHSPAQTHMTSCGSETRLRRIQQLVALLWALVVANSPWHSAARPVIYPAPTNDPHLFVHDQSNGTLMRHPGGLRSFFCDACPSDVILHTASERLHLIVSWLGDSGYAIPFPQNLTIDEVNSARTERIGPDTTEAAAVNFKLNLDVKKQPFIVAVRSGEWELNLRIKKDATRPRVEIDIADRFEAENVFEYTIHITFSKSVVWDPEFMTCPEMARINRLDVNASALMAQSDECSNDLLEKPMESGVSVEGAELVDVRQSGFEELMMAVHVPDKNLTTDIVITVHQGYIDFTGQPVPSESLLIQYRPFPPPRDRQRRLIRRDVNFDVRFSKEESEEETVGTVTGTVTTAAVAVSTSTAIGVSSASGGVGAGTMITLLNAMQLLYISGKLPVRKLPENYKNFTRQLKWTALDIRTPWESEHRHDDADKQQGIAAQKGQRNLKAFEFLLSSEQGESSVQYFNRMIFWVPTLFFVLLLFHLICLACLLFWQKPIPDMLHLPRLELMLAYFVLPPISIAAAGLFTGNREQAMVATWVIVAFPAHFIAWNVFMIWYYILRLPPHLREVNLLMDIPDETEKPTKPRFQSSFFRTQRRRRSTGHRRSGSASALLPAQTKQATPHKPVILELVSFKEDPEMHQEKRPTMHSAAVFEGEDTKTLGSDVNETEAASCREIMRSISNMTILTFFFGEHQEEAEWVGTKTQGSKFNARFGVLFEDHRGPAVGRRNVTYEIDPVTKQVNRGDLVILRERPLFAVPAIRVENNRMHISKKRIYRHHVQSMAKILSISKTLLVGCIVAGVGNEKDNAACLVALIVASIVLVFLFRIAKPFPSRIDMIMLLLSEIADLIVYTSALCIILSPTSESTREDIGLALMVSKVVAMIVMVLDYWFFSIGFGIDQFTSFLERKPEKFFPLAHQMLMMNERYLERKYFDRWMARVLSRGLHGRIPESHELSGMCAIRLMMHEAWRHVHWLQNEIQSIWNDAVNKWTCVWGSK